MSGNDEFRSVRMALATRHNMRCSAVPGYQSRFNAEFLKRAGDHPAGMVDTEKLAADVLAQIGVADPCKPLAPDVQSIIQRRAEAGQ